MRDAIIIQARMGSTRLPGKVLKRLGDKTVLEQVIFRAEQAVSRENIIIATTENDADLPIVHLARRLGVKCARGSEHDVLSRYYLAARHYEVKNIIRITSDCPLIDPYIIKNIIEQFHQQGLHERLAIYSNTRQRTFPRGLDVEMFSFTALEKAYREGRTAFQREHVTPFLYDSPEINVHHYLNEVDFSKYRWTLDTIEDWDLLDYIFKNLLKQNKMIDTQNVLELFKMQPDLIKINEHIIQQS